MVQQINGNDYNNYSTLKAHPSRSPLFGANATEEKDGFVSTIKPEQEKGSFRTYFEGALALIAAGSVAFAAKYKINLKDSNKAAEQAKKVISEALTTAGEKIHENIAENASKLGEIATRDALSGMYNRKSLDAALVKTFSEAVSGKKDMHMAMMDMDYFKSINDVLGHDVGDKFIQRLGANIRAVTEKHGISGYRYGGEEFAVLMPGHNTESSRKIIAEVVQTIKDDKEIQGHKELFLKTAREQLAGFREKQAKFNPIWDEIRNNPQEAEKKALAERILKLLKENKIKIPPEQRKPLRELFAELHKIVKSDSQANTPNLQDLLAKHPIMGTRLNQSHNRQKEINAWEAWIKHVETNGFTISAGISDISHTSGQNPEELFKLADKTLDSSKKAGRNKVSISSKPVASK